MIDAVRIQNETGVGYDTKITDAKTGQTVHGVESLGVQIDVRGLVKADLRLAAALTDVQAAPTFYMTDSKSGEWRAVKAIEWSDGERTEL